jgi:hypothetical protein
MAMLAALTRLQALAVVLVIVLLAAWSLTIRPTDARSAAITGNGRYPDVRLYHDIGDAVATGEPYYRAAVRLHRAHGFPTRPFVTVRLPTLAWIEGALGWKAAGLLLQMLLAGAAFAWFAMLRPLASMPERLGAAALVLVGGVMAASPTLLVSHELWAGILLALATPLLVRGAWVPALIAVACALAIRELAAPFVLIAAFHAWRGGRWREAIACLALLAVYALALLAHRAAVVPLSLASDVRSQGWDALRGAQAPLQDLVDVTLLNQVPVPLGYLLAVLAMTGFLGAPRPLARIVLPWFAVIVVVLAVFARPVNFYWAILMAPMLLAGLAFLPRVAMDLARALRR